QSLTERDLRRVSQNLLGLRHIKILPHAPLPRPIRGPDDLHSRSTGLHALRKNTGDGVLPPIADLEVLTHHLFGFGFNPEHPSVDGICCVGRVSGLFSTLQDTGVSPEYVPKPFEDEDLPSHVRTIDYPIPVNDDRDSIRAVPGQGHQLLSTLRRTVRIYRAGGWSGGIGSSKGLCTAL